VVGQFFSDPAVETPAGLSVDLQPCSDWVWLRPLPVWRVTLFPEREVPLFASQILATLMIYVNMDCFLYGQEKLSF
jgi:hypothetical protein